MRRLTVILLLLALFACERKKEPQNVIVSVNLQPLARVESGSGSSMLEVKWASGDRLGIASDTYPEGISVSVSQNMVSGGALEADVSSVSEGAGAYFFAKGVINSGKAELVPVFDGSLKDSYAAVGKCASVDRSVTLSPVFGLCEFSFAKTGIYGVRIIAEKEVFPERAVYDFGSGKIGAISARSTMEVSALSPVRVFVPLVPGANLEGCMFEFLDSSGDVLATCRNETALAVNPGTVCSLGQIDSDADFPGSGTDLSQGMDNAAQIMPKMGIGLNLCGTFDDVLPYDGVSGDRSDPITFETLHKQGVTTQVTMDSMYEAGFRTLRVPITWYAHMDNTLATIDKVFLDRIEEIVNYALKAGLYCIINVHHDTGTNVNTWIWADMDKYSDISPRFKNIWGQIARRFRDYDDRLLFEGYNELLDTRQSWGYPKVAGAIEAANRLNQDFVDIVRSTGGRNYARNLIVSTYATSCTPNALKEFILPKDRLEGRLIAQVHSYVPWEFCGPDVNGLKELPESYVPVIENEFVNIKTGLLEKGIPCILGEYGAFPLSTRTQQQLGHHAAIYTRAALRNGVVPVYWYNPMAYQNRTSGKWSYPEVKDSLITAYRDFLSK